MILEFKDGKQINVESIYGFPRLVLGHMRDTLVIKMDPKKVGLSFDQIHELFCDNDETMLMYLYEDEYSEKKLVGEGYNIFVSLSSEREKVYNPPGRIVEERVVDRIIVTMAQMTYDEFTSSTASFSS